MRRLIREDTSLIVSLDVPTLEKAGTVVSETKDVPGVSAYKLGFELVGRYGLIATGNRIREIAPRKKIIYDHQKAGNDVMHMSERMVKMCKECGMDALIVFPISSGVDVELAFIADSEKYGLPLIIGGDLTEFGSKAKNGGFVCDDAAERIFSTAYNAGERNFVIPGNDSELVAYYNSFFAKDAIFYLPGFLRQGGDLKEVKVLLEGRRWHAIVGGAIYGASDIKKATSNLVKKII